LDFGEKTFLETLSVTSPDKRASMPAWQFDS